jgi:hypothetical protein
MEPDHMMMPPTGTTPEPTAPAVAHDASPSVEEFLVRT